MRAHNAHPRQSANLRHRSACWLLLMAALALAMSLACGDETAEPTANDPDRDMRRTIRAAVAETEKTEAAAAALQTEDAAPTTERQVSQSTEATATTTEPAAGTVMVPTATLTSQSPKATPDWEPTDLRWWRESTGNQTPAAVLEAHPYRIALDVLHGDFQSLRDAGYEITDEETHAIQRYYSEAYERHNYGKEFGQIRGNVWKRFLSEAGWEIIDPEKPIVRYWTQVPAPVGPYEPNRRAVFVVEYRTHYLEGMLEKDSPWIGLYEYIENTRELSDEFVIAGVRPGTALFTNLCRNCSFGRGVSSMEIQEPMPLDAAITAQWEPNDIRWYQDPSRGGRTHLTAVLENHPLGLHLDMLDGEPEWDNRVHTEGPRHIGYEKDIEALWEFVREQNIKDLNSVLYRIIQDHVVQSPDLYFDFLSEIKEPIGSRDLGWEVIDQEEALVRYSLNLAIGGPWTLNERELERYMTRVRKSSTEELTDAELRRSADRLSERRGTVIQDTHIVFVVRYGTISAHDRMPTNAANALEKNPAYRGVVLGLPQLVGAVNWEIQDPFYKGAGKLIDPWCRNYDTHNTCLFDWAIVAYCDLWPDSTRQMCTDIPQQ